MKIEIKDIKLTNRDVKKGLILPTKATEDLAYLCGILAGDGNIQVRKEKFDYSVRCAGNPADEKEFYHTVIGPRFKKVFNISIKIRPYDKGTTYGFAIYSRALVLFLTGKMSLPIGKKYKKLCIPKFFKKDSKLILAFIRGVADTDFYVGIKKKNGNGPGYPRISGCSKSKEFLEEIAKEIEKNSMSVSRCYDVVCFDKRFKRGYNIINRIYINGKKNLKTWMDLIGFNSPKHLHKLINFINQE